MPTQKLREYAGGGLVGASIKGSGFLLSPNSDGVIADSNGINSANSVPYTAIRDEHPFFKVHNEGYVKQSDVDAMLISGAISSAGQTSFVVLNSASNAGRELIKDNDYILLGNTVNGISTGFNGENQEIIKVTDVTFDGNLTYAINHCKRGCFGTTATTFATLDTMLGQYIRGSHCDYFSSIKLLNQKVRIKKLVDYKGIDIIAASGLSYIELVNGQSIDGKFIEVQRDESWNSSRGALLIHRT